MDWFSTAIAPSCQGITVELPTSVVWVVLTQGYGMPSATGESDSASSKWAAGRKGGTAKMSVTVCIYTRWTPFPAPIRSTWTKDDKDMEALRLGGGAFAGGFGLLV